MDEEIFRKGAIVIAKLRKGEIVWKPGKDKKHLGTRKKLKHIPEDFTLVDYNDIIKSMVTENENEVYLYYKELFGQKYFSVGDRSKHWELIVGENGIMETAYRIKIKDFDKHFQKGEYTFIGSLEEVEEFENYDERYN